MIAIVYITMPNYKLKPQGIVLPTHGHYESYQGSVQLFHEWNRPANAVTIGKLTVEYHSKTYNQQASMRALAKAQQLAAKAGGNALVYSIEHTIPSIPTSHAKLIIEGTVIHTQSESIK